MNELEEQVTQRLRACADAVHVSVPSTRIVVERVARRRRRRIAGRAVIGVAAAIVMIAGLVAVTTRGGGNPVTSNPERPSNNTVTASTVPSSGAEPTLDITDPTAAADQWSRLADNNLAARSEHLVVATDTGLFVWGGDGPSGNLTDGAYYDNASRSWRALPPAPLATDRGDAVGVWSGTDIVVINGIIGNVKSAAFDPATFRWRSLPDPPVDNAANATSQAVYTDGTVLLFTIDEDNGPARDRVARLDMHSDDWSVVAAPPVALKSSVGVVAAGTDVLVVGQTDNPPGCAVLHVLAYSPSMNTWRELPSGPVANRADPVTVWTGSELFVGGGGSCDNGVAAATSEDHASLLNPNTGQWRDTARAPVGFYSSYRYPDMWTGASVATLAPDGRPLLYNPVTDAWHLGPEINGTHPIAPNQTPIVATNHTIVVSGGRITQAGELCCDPFTGTYAYSIPAGF
jgi:hypothetical protein